MPTGSLLFLGRMEYQDKNEILWKFNDDEIRALLSAFSQSVYSDGEVFDQYPTMTSLMGCGTMVSSFSVPFRN